MKGVDHLLYAVPELEAGMEAVERRLGVRPVVGGRHPAYGTHNALVSLGPATYLEIIAPDPGRDPARDRGSGVLLAEQAAAGPRLATWVARDEDLERAAAALRSVGIEPGAIAAGQRRTPSGAVLEWRLTDPYALPLDGAVPFLIAWGETPHPAASAPDAGRLVGLRIEHPEADRVAAAVRALGVAAEVRKAQQPAIVASVETRRGRVELR